MLFRYLAKDNDQNIIHGELSADNKSTAEKILQQNGINIELIQPVYDTGRSNILKKTALSIRDRRNFFRQKSSWFEELAVMLSAGLNINQCLQVLLRKTNNGDVLGRIMLALQERIAGGMALSEAMSCCDDIFSQTEIRSVRAAEKIGHPELALQKLSAVGRHVENMTKKIKSALVYPVIVLLSSIIALIVLVSFVVPKFETIFFSNGSRVELPAITRGLLSCCKFFQGHIVGIVLSVIMISVGVLKLMRYSKFRLLLFDIMSKIPLFNRIYIAVDLHNFFRTMHMLLAFKMSLQDAMSLSITLINHSNLRRSMQHILSRLLCGETLSDCFQNCSMIPAQVCGLIYAGEHAGDIALAFERASESYENEVLSQLTIVTTLIEPVMIIILAIIVGTIAIALFLPMNTMISHIS